MMVAVVVVVACASEVVVVPVVVASMVGTKRRWAPALVKNCSRTTMVSSVSSMIS